jgi:hypothetical protein
VGQVRLIGLLMEAARTSETSVDIQLRTWQYIPEDSELHTRRRENLKSHKVSLLLARHQTRSLVSDLCIIVFVLKVFTLF